MTSPADARGARSGAVPDAAGAAGTDAPEAADRQALRRDLASSARASGRRAVLSGRWLGDTVVDLAPRVPVRDRATSSAHHDGSTGTTLARSLTRAAGRVSGGVGAATGTVMAAQQLSVAGLLLVPFELAAETAVVVLVELKLLAELHAVAERPLPGGPLERSQAALLVWTSGHALPERRVPGSAEAPVWGRSSRRQLGDALRARLTRNLTTVAPLLTGAVAAGALNRHATVSLGHRLTRELDIPG